ncbi:arginase family protein [Ktedonosporobacter rubrisoli]|uniref:arginase family protein n=1 Tax=Ktedonosporobacter rubrisoli TaxID=2509675 RepID=UPI0013EEA5B8|nr:arginase family protein [Ktedonosporobacter rubrisoli]
MKIRLIQVPYDLGQENIGMGKAPERYLQAGVEEMLSRQGFTVTVERIQREGPFQNLLHTVAEVNTRLAQAVRQAIAQDEFPLILGGTCSVCMGTLSGFDHSQSGIIWFDAHGDFNTPETSISGYFDGMSLAIATGHCYQDLWSQIGNSVPVAEDHTLLIGVRDLDPQEEKDLKQSQIHIASVESVQRARETADFASQLDELAMHVHDIYLHFDLDVLDPQDEPGINFPTPGGPSLQEVEQALHMIAKRFHVKAAALTAYNPELDREDKTLRVGMHLLSVLAESARY